MSLSPKVSGSHSSLRKQPVLYNAITDFPTKIYAWGTTTEIQMTDDIHCYQNPDLGNASDWMKQIFNQPEAPPGSGSWHAISMEFLQSFLTHYSIGQPVLASQIVGCSLRLHVDSLQSNNFIGLFEWKSFCLSFEKFLILDLFIIIIPPLKQVTAILNLLSFSMAILKIIW